MKRFTVLAALLSLVVAVGWASFQAVSESNASPERKYDNMPILIYDARAELEKAINTQDDIIPVSGAGAAIVPVYDATGAMLEAITPKEAKEAQGVPLRFPCVTLPAHC